ncbi:hypothetical protein DSO57_1002935 [Entomophthora muscae]|uniref:Uncharacterized protein n=1 Tax=Entomophthora muscae TaxID=34485 RepID=A0ACC2T8Q9_9FUNG|nr:hypothetical protein DSO57_1002935 [Entomophthora muscae]
MKLPPSHKNFSLSHLPDGGIVPRAKAEGNVMTLIKQLIANGLKLLQFAGQI